MALATTALTATKVVLPVLPMIVKEFEAGISAFAKYVKGGDPTPY